MKRAKTLLLAGSLLLSSNAMADAIPVELIRSENGWQLLRRGEPYFIRGAGGDHSLAALAAAGANSIRTWDAENVRGAADVGPLLDEAHALGMTVTVGIWLGHERHGFDYDDALQVRQQLDRARGIVERFKDHPALLLWGIGNEMEGFDDGDNPAIWRAVNDVAAMVKSIDPHHPTMTVTSFVHGERIDFVHRQSPSIDIHGVNAYGGAPVVHQWLRDAGADKPFVITEFGPPGPWEIEETPWGAPYEPTSSQKADAYHRSYREAVQAQSDIALGSYAFLWGHKMEATPTWFGMWLDDGARLAAVDAMQEAWSGEAPDDLAPRVEPLSIEGSPAVEPGDTLIVSAAAADPEGARLRAVWSLLPETGDYLTGGDFRPGLAAMEGAIVEQSTTSAVVRMPTQPGPYRLYYTVYDESGGAGTANIPLLVNGERRLPMPFPVYEDGFDGMPWAPSGWMGGVEELTLDGRSTEQVFAGAHSIRMRYEGRFGWAGVAWQHPANNWGDSEGGFDLTGATSLEVWARGQYGGEKVGFGVGLLENDTSHPDSDIAEVQEVRLSREWTRYEVPLRRRDLSSIKTGFVVTLVGRETPVTVFLDRIRYVR
ncbi:MAG: glycoside hydrolase family 2 TIM barrel-domain containing protein [Pseudomonadota bacterium]